VAGAFHKLYVVEAEDSRVVVVTLNYTRFFLYNASGIFVPQFNVYTCCSLCSLACRYDNPIPTRLLTPIDCSKTTEQEEFFIIEKLE
jgi:hypothetical protein